MMTCNLNIKAIPIGGMSSSRKKQLGSKDFFKLMCMDIIVYLLVWDTTIRSWVLNKRKEINDKLLINTKHMSLLSSGILF